MDGRHGDKRRSGYAKDDLKRSRHGLLAVASPSNENKVSDGHRERASTEAKTF
jgi:hypothetical protein